MIIFLYGQDTYRSREKLREIIEHYNKVHKSGLNVKFFAGEKLSYKELDDDFRQTPMFKEKKLFLLQNVFQSPDFKSAFLKQAQKFVDSKDIIIFHEEEESSPQDPLFKFLKSEAKAQEFKPLKGQELKNWARKEFGKYQTKIDPLALEILVKYVGNELWRFSNEVKKLVAYKNGKNIESKDLFSLLVRPRIEPDIFRTVDAIAAKNKKEAFSLLHKHLERGDSPLYLLTMVNFQFRNLLLVKESKKPDLHPYILRKSSWQARHFSLEELKKIYHKLLEIDLAVKTGRLEPNTALDLLITEI